MCFAFSCKINVKIILHFIIAREYILLCIKDITLGASTHSIFLIAKRNDEKIINDENDQLKKLINTLTIKRIVDYLCVIREISY